MLKQTVRPVLAAAVFLAAGCASSGLSVREDGNNTISSYLSAMPSLTARAATSPAAATATAGVPRPASVAVVQVGEVAPPDSLLTALRGRPDLFREVQGLSGVAPEQPLAADYNARRRYGYRAVPVSAVEPRDQMADLLQLAEDVGADALLIFGGTIDADEQAGWQGVLDLTIIGAFVVPSRKLTAEGKATAAWVDVDARRVLATASAGVDRSTLATTAGREGSQRKQMRRVRDELVKELTGDLIQRFETLATPAAAASAR